MQALAKFADEVTDREENIVKTLLQGRWSGLSIISRTPIVALGLEPRSWYNVPEAYHFGKLAFLPFLIGVSVCV